MKHEFQLKRRAINNFGLKFTSSTSQIHYLMKPICFAIIFSLLLAGVSAQPITGTKTIPGDYAKIVDAISALNLNGTTAPGVTFDIASGYIESENLGVVRYIINTTTGSAASPIVFRKVPGGAVNPKINVVSGTGNSTTDAGFMIAGTDYVTVDGIDISADNSIEWGYALVKKNNVAPFDGCQNVTIKNCSILLNKTNGQTTVGIYTGNHIATNTTALTITSTTDAHNNCKFFGNTISNVSNGIGLNGYNAPSPYSLFDQNNEVGLDAANIISDYGNTYSPVGIFANYQQNVNISNNTVTSATPAYASSGFYGIELLTASAVSAIVNNNTISINCSNAVNVYGIYSSFGASGATNTISINNNTIQNCVYSGVNGCTFYGVFNSITGSSSLPAMVNINNNNIHDITAQGTGYLYALEAGSASNLNINGNQIYNITKSGNANLYGITGHTGTITINNNSIHDLTTTTGTGYIYGLYDNASPANETYTNNIISNLIHNSTGEVYGMYLNTAAGTRNCSFNTIHGLSSAGGAVSGMYQAYSTPFINGNNIYDLTSTTSAGIVNGIYIDGGTNPVVSNNFISDLKTPQATNTNAIRGIYKRSGNVGYCHYNTIYLDASSSSTSTFGTSGIYADTYWNVELKNNIVVNTSIPVAITGPAFTVAYRRSNSTISSYSSTSNNNCFYAGTPGPNNLIYFDETNGDQSVALYKVRVSPREAASFSELPPFVSIAAHNFHITPGTPTAIESSVVKITSPVPIPADIDNDIRWGETGYSGTGTAPDAGADEGNHTNLPTMTFQSASLTQQTAFVFAGNTNQAILRIKVSVYGGPTPLSATQFIVNANGTTDIGDINVSPAKIYYTSNSSYFGLGILFGSATPTLTNFNINGNQLLTNGDNYFWLVYDLKQTALTGHFIDGECVGINISGSVKTPAITAPEGKREIYGPMSGTYLVGVGNSYPNFQTLSDAIVHLNNRGLSGPVVLSLTNTASIPYNAANGEIFPIMVNEIPLSSAINTVTLKPASGKDPIISGNSTTSTFFINGTDYFIIDGSNSGNTTRSLIIENISTGNYTAGLQISTGTNSLGANHNTIKNCKIRGGGTEAANWGICALSVGSTIAVTGADNDYLTLDNNEFTKGYYGVFLGGTTGNVMDNLTITNNTIGSDDVNYYNRHCGAYLTNTLGTFTNNDIKGVVATINGTYNSYGLYLAPGVKNMTFAKNKIHSIGSASSSKNGTALAIDLASAGNNVTIANNTIYNILGNGSSNLYSYGTCGIKIIGYSTNVKIYYNSVYLSGKISNPTSTSDASAALFIWSSASQIDIRNNIFINSIENTTGVSKAYAVYSEAPGSSFTALDYNDYLVSGNEGIFGYLTSDKTSLAAWKSAIGKDVNSISADPDFNSLPNLQPYGGSAVLDLCPALSVTDDYNNVTRTVPTSMGAFEHGSDVSAPVILYQPLYNTHSLGARILTVNIQDYHGSVPVSGSGLPRLYWKINSNQYSIVSGVWISGNTYQFTFGAGVSSGNTVSYFIVAQDTVSNPNVGCYPSTSASGFGSNPPSCSVYPSNPSTYSIVPALSGIKNIPGDYPNLTGASGLFADMNSKTLTGNLTVNIVGNLNEDGTNVLNEINVEDTSFHLSIIVPGSIYRTITGNYQGTLIRFNGADGVSLNGNGKLKIANNSTGPAVVLDLTNGSNNNLIKGCRFLCGSNNLTSSNTGIKLSGPNFNNTIQNDTISKCYYGIYIDGIYWNQSAGNKIYNNVIGTNTASDYIWQTGIYALYQDGLVISGNEVFNVISNSSPKGIYTEGITNSIIEKNFLHDIYYNGSSYDGASGITFKALNATPNITLRNNVIRRMAGLGDCPNAADYNTIPAGIKLFGNATSGINVYYNSVYMVPDPVYGQYYNNEWTTALEIGAGVSGINLVNNILQNSVGERSALSITSYCYSIYCKSATSPFATINNNIYFTSNCDNNYVGLVGTAKPPVNNKNLAAWQAFTGQDAQSLNIDPLYTSVSNMMPQASSPAIGAGFLLAGTVDDDYLGHLRGNPTTIGAYELTAAASKTLNVTVLLEGLYKGGGKMRPAMDANGPHFGNATADLITIELHSSVAGNFSSKLYSTTALLDTNGFVQLSTPSGLNGSYYIVVKHRNSIQTVSSNPVSFSSTSINYNFTNSASSAYGNNLKTLGGGKYGVYTGDTNNDGIINAMDLNGIGNDASGFIQGYVTSDLSGDGIVDALDLIQADSNAANFVSAHTP